MLMFIAVVVAAAVLEVAVAILSIVDVPMSILKAKYQNHLIVGFPKSGQFNLFRFEGGKHRSYISR